MTLPTIGQNGLHNVMVFLTTWTYLALTLYYDAALVSLLVHLCVTRGQHNLRNEQTETPRMRQNSEIRTDRWLDEDSEKQQLTISEKHAADENSGILDAMRFKSCDKITWHMKITWVFANVIYVSALLVTLLFYVAVYNEYSNDFMNFNTHLLNSVLILIDSFIVARPVRILHVFHSLLYGLAYLVFSIIYWSKDKENNVLYENIIDFNRPWRTVWVVCGIALVLVPGFHMLHFGIYRLRLYLYNKYCSRSTRYDNL